MPSLNDKLMEMQKLISKMPLKLCRTMTLPEFQVKWLEVSRAVRNARLPMLSSSVARVLCAHSKRNLPEEEIDEILGRLRLRLVASQSRTWHVIKLQEPTTDEPFAVTMRKLPRRVAQSMQNKNKKMSPEVQSLFIEDIMYMSVQMISDAKCSSILYVATPPGEQVALVTSLAPAMLKYCVQGLGYKTYEDAGLHGKDIYSLLRIVNEAWAANADHLASIPEYQPIPTILPTGIDYTHKTYDKNYVEAILGPNPPLLTDLKMQSNKMFFDTNRLNKPMSIKMELKTDNVAESLKNWVNIGALAPTSDVIKIFHKVKSNDINMEDSE